MLLVDANVLIDVLSDDPDWRPWSEARLLEAAAEDELAINPLIFAEVAMGYRSERELQDALRPWPLTRLELPYEACFLAAQAFLRYRREGGQRRSPLPDFYIGAHAVCAGMRLLTRDTARYRSYFSTLELIAPA